MEYAKSAGQLSDTLINDLSIKKENNSREKANHGEEQFHF